MAGTALIAPGGGPLGGQERYGIGLRVRSRPQCEQFVRLRFALFGRGVAKRRRAARKRPSRGPRRGAPWGSRRHSSQITSQTFAAPPFAVRRDLHVKVRGLWRSVAPVRARCSSARRFSRRCARFGALLPRALLARLRAPFLRKTRCESARRLGSRVAVICT